MGLNKLTLKDQKLFNQHLALSARELAAFSFANIYICKDLFDIRWALIGSALCIFFCDEIGCFMYLPPLGKERNPKIIKQAFEIMDGLNKNKDISRIENIPQQDWQDYRALGYICRDKYPDYLCLRRDLALLRGNKFKSQRASYNYFVKHHDFTRERFEAKYAPACQSLFNSWAELRKEHGSNNIYRGMIEDNRKLIKVALANYKQLGFEGIIIRVNKQVKGFTFGYKLSNDIFCILYEITDLSVKGLAQFIFRKFSEELKAYKYINIMDDSGLENLRKVKLSYKPARLIPAYIITRDAQTY